MRPYSSCTPSRRVFDLGIAMQLYGASDTSEYGRFENIYYASVQWFF